MNLDSIAVIKIGLAASNLKCNTPSCKVSHVKSDHILTLPPKNVSLAECFNAFKENRDGKTVRARYTLEFKQEAARLVTGGQSVAAVARSR